MSGPTRPKTSNTVFMKGGGYYSSKTQGAKDVINNALDLVLGAIDDMGISQDNRPFSIADYGTADGGTSHDLIRNAIGAIKGKAPKRPIYVYYNDLPRNDFSALFSLLHDEDNSLGIRSYLKDHDNVFVFASGTSFYQQIFTDNSIDFGFSATSMHWLSEKPGIISNHIQAVGAEGAELQAFAARAMKDWETILLHRSAELAPGGRLVLVNFCRDEKGRYLGNTGGVSMWDTFNNIWSGLASEGKISEEEYTDTSFPQFYKTVEEFTSPFFSSDSDVRRAGLSLDHVETRMVKCPYVATYRDTGDIDSFAPAYIASMRSWTESTFFNSLDPSRSLDEREDIIDALYDRYEGIVRDAPDVHSMDYIHVYMVISKA